MTTRKETKTNGTTISYLETNSTGSVILFFIHGNSSSAAVYYKQLESAVLSSYHLVAFDLPAHGHSASLPPDKYSLQYLGELMAAAIKTISNGKPYFLIGFSFGANIAAETLAYSLQPKGIVLLGPTILGGRYTLEQVLKKDADLTALFVDEAEEAVVMELIRTACHTTNASDHQLLLHNYQNVQAPFRSVLLRPELLRQMSDQIQLLQQQAVPLLVVFGEQDRLVNNDYLDGAGLPLWRSMIYKIPNAGHFIGLDQPEALNRLLQQYVNAVLTDSHAAWHSSATL